LYLHFKKKHRLTDFENAVLGLTPHYYHQIKYWNRCVTCEDVTVFLFGVVLFEMATGSEFHVTSYDISRIQSEILREVSINFYFCFEKKKKMTIISLTYFDF